jgi:hypothetical protein
MNESSRANLKVEQVLKGGQLGHSFLGIALNYRAKYSEEPSMVLFLIQQDSIERLVAGAIKIGACLFCDICLK